ncbi:PROTEIN SRG1 [Salix koriyanagi]|uniref:PROTEIN SRG1 n=1 Tax=Salix koriyanagi TaxID=2511006 RepID=A0A9Q0WQ96_9ROSI|nr:PROTEIN SRG1 [Salix koriyanagi]
MAPVPISPINVGHIDDVQELRKSGPATIPERFVRDMTERPTLDTGHTAPPFPNTVPVIDFSRLVKGNKEEHKSEMLELTRACEEWGFFQVINHGIDLGLLKSIEKVAKDFFMLPLDEKQKHQMLPGTVQGYGQAFVFSEDQKLDWCNMLALGLEPHFIRVPELWPTEPLKFSETVEIYSGEVRKLCQHLLEYIAMTLNLRADFFEEMFGVAQGKGSPGGLQILKDSIWVPVQPVPNAFVINIGDTLEVLTNGKYKSVEHRAVTDREKDRLSIVTFYAPSYETELGPIPELVDENNPCKYRTYNHGEYSKHYVTSKLQGKKTLEFAKVESKIATS